MKEQINKYLNQNKSLSFSELLFSYIDKSGKSDSKIYNNVNIDRKLFSKIRCNENYLPKKINVIKLCISLNLDLEDTKKLLKSAGYSLSTNNDFDLIISYFIENNIYNVDIINNYLFTYTSTTLI